MISDYQLELEAAHLLGEPTDPNPEYARALSELVAVATGLSLNDAPRVLALLRGKAPWYPPKVESDGQTFEYRAVINGAETACDYCGEYGADWTSGYDAACPHCLAQMLRKDNT